LIPFGDIVLVYAMPQGIVIREVDLYYSASISHY